MIAVVERTFAILTLVCVGVSAATLGALVTDRVPRWVTQDLALPLATAIAVVATAGSLFLSEVAGYIPCTLCWYQRIAMYPLTIVLGVATWRRDRHAWMTVLPMAAIGSAISVWHVVIERRPSLGGVCDPAAPCAIRWIEEFGFMTIPVMAATGFITIALLSLAAGRDAQGRQGEPYGEATTEEATTEEASEPSR